MDVIRLAAVLVLAAQVPTEAEMDDTLPVRWRGDMFYFDQIQTQSDIDRALDTPLRKGEWVGIIKMAPVDDANEPILDQVIEVTTSRDYLEAVAAGMSPRHTGDTISGKNNNAFDSWANALWLLQRMRPSRESYVQDFVLARDALSDLPAHWFANRTWESEGLDRMNAGVEEVPEEGFPWGFQLRAVSPWEVEFHPLSEADGEWEGGGSLDQYRRTSVLAWGDANGDGVEDLIVFQRFGWFGGGAYWWHRVVLLTRFDESERLVEVPYEAVVSPR